QEAFTNWLNSVGLLSILTTMNQSTVAIISLVACFGIAYRLSEGYGTDGPSAGIIALSSFVLMAPRFSSMVYDKNGEQVKQLFGGAIRITIKMPSGVPDVVSKSFSALLPGFTTFVLWALVLKGLEAAGVAGGLNGLLGAIVGTPLKLIAGTLPGMILCVIVNSFFWFCGVNGGQVLNAFVDPVWLQFTTENQEAVAAGQTLQHIITLPFKDLFVFIGGGGATIGLAICLFLFSKSRANKTLGKLAIIPSIFNINTAILFTFPTVLNPIMLIPFIATPTINALITYVSMAVGLVPYTTGVILPWTM
ncbi:PTS sugar transporter subunit IIC, partial [Streptococcus pneumoniae]|uniref:PTS sugar transporter subunit IIC n=1 Tax=Streptococcus pneumoniae TaxID=1313 RepID=UPI00077BD07E